VETNHLQHSSPWQSFLPYHTALDILENSGKNPVGREQRFDALVLFADVSGFTAISEALGAAGRQGTEELTTILNGYFSPMIALIQVHGGVIGKFGGDAMTVLFPLKPAQEQRVVRLGVQCALEMQKRMDRYLDIPTSAGLFQLGMKAGLALGSVYCTSVGDPEMRLEYIIAGEPLDLCAEAEHLAKKGEVVVHSSVQALLKTGMVGEDRGGFICITGLDNVVQPAPLMDLPPFSTEAERLAAAYIHPSIAERLRSGQSGFINEHRKTTILFVSFPALDYLYDVEIGKRLQGYFIQVFEIVTRYDGYLNKIDMGDKGSKYIIVFGAPIAHEDDSARALRCAIELQELAQQSGFTLRIGVNSGYVFCGQVGSQLRREYTVMGDAVNLAARLMQAAQHGQTLVSAAVWRSVQTVRQSSLQLNWGEPVELKVKGKSELIQVYPLLQTQKARTVQSMEPAYILPMVGRQKELDQAAETIQKARAGIGQVLGVTAEAGMGKSRLAAEIIQLAVCQNFSVHGGECLSHQSNTRYLVWRGILRGLLQIDASLSTKEQTAALEKKITALNPSWLVRLPLIGAALNLAIPENDLTRSLDGRLRKESLENLIVDLVRLLAADSPLMLVFEDCHWIDPLSDDLLEALGGSRDLPVLLLVVYRPPEAAPSVRQALKVVSLPHFYEIHLVEFTPQEAQQLITMKLNQLFASEGDLQEFHRDLAVKLAARAQGNPFYIDEMVNYIHDRGINPQNASALERIDLPDSLHSLIMSRMDQLTEAAKITLKVASVIGRSFRASWLWGVYPEVGLPDQVRAQLVELSRLEITPLDKPEPELEYLFKHIVTREVAYASISVATRQMLHEQTGGFLERLYSDRIDRFLDLLAYHFGLSTNLDRQKIYFRKAGEAAQASYANAAALDYYQRLLPLVSSEEKVQILTKIGEVYELTGEWQLADNSYCEGLEIARSYLETMPSEVAATDTDMAPIHARLCFSLGNLRRSKGDFEDSLIWLNKACDEFTRINDPAGLCTALRATGIVYWGQGDYDMAIDYYNKTLNLAEQNDDLRSVYRSLNNIGQVYYAQGKLEEALYFYKKSMDLAVKAGDHFSEGISIGNIGGVYLEQGRHSQAMAAFMKSYEFGTQIGYRFLVNVALGNMGSVYLDYGQWQNALTCYRLNLRVALQMGDRLGVALALKGLALANADERDAMLAKAVALGRELETPLELSEFLFAQADLYTQQGKYELAEAANSEAHQLSLDVEWDYIQFRTEVLAVRLLLLLEKISKTQAKDDLLTLLKRWEQPEQQAALFYSLYKLSTAQIKSEPTDSGEQEEIDKIENWRERAAETYNGLYISSPVYEYRQRLDELGRRIETAPPALPELIEAVVKEHVDLEKLLSQIHVSSM